jgi:MarR family transcriptional regulator, organic hydroperoxide resistance regulator
MHPAAASPPSTGFLLWHVTLRWRAALDHALTPLRITASQYAVLASLHGLSRAGTRPSQRELADFSGLGAMYVSKLVRSLEHSGLLHRATSAADPRAVELTITERGLEVVRAGAATVRALEEWRLAPLGGRESERSVVLRELLFALLRHAQASNDARQPSPPGLVRLDAIPTPEVNQ